MVAHSRTLLASCAGAVLVLAACSAGRVSLGPPERAVPPSEAGRGAQTLRVASSPPPPPRAPARRGWLSPEAAAPNEVIYVANSSEVVVFPKRGRNPHPVGEISEGVTSAYGLFVDPEKNLYVCNQGENNVRVYPPGETTPSITYKHGLHRPLYAAADGTRVFVGNANGGTIAMYKKGDKRLRGTLATLGTEVDGLNFDAEGNLYAAYRNGGGDGGIEFFPGGAGPGTDLGIKLNAPQGLAIDPAGNVLVVETQGTDRVDVFRPHSTRPLQTLEIPSVPTQVQLGDRDQRVYVSDLNDTIYFSTYPELRQPGEKIDNSVNSVQGMAVSPPSEP
jgi:DNA-binding beta-propeller fold protein YncE